MSRWLLADVVAVSAHRFYFDSTDRLQQDEFAEDQKSLRAWFAENPCKQPPSSLNPLPSRGRLTERRSAETSETDAMVIQRGCYEI